MQNEYKTIKISDEATRRFDLISTNAPDHIIKAQLMYLAVCKEEGKKIPKKSYKIIEEFGYAANHIGDQDTLSKEDLENTYIDKRYVLFLY